MEIFRNNKHKIKFSVLMSIYSKEKPIYFRQAVESVVDQTVKPTEIVIVKDGPLTNELEKECSNLQERYPQQIRFVALKKNVGLGLALQKGVMECNYNLIARMDTDDMSKCDRFEKQLKAFVDNPNIVICGGYIEEFTKNVNQINSVRSVPLTNDDIYEFGKKRNPFNHMTTMFKKEFVLSAGNYQDFYLLEDYYLWFRMIMNNYKMMNLQDVLVSVRTGDDMAKRRGGWKYFKSEKKLYDIFRKERYINTYQYMYIIIVRMISRLIPNQARKLVYNELLR